MELARYENAKTAIEAYKTVDEVKEFRDKAVAVQAYAKQANDYQLERDAAIARVRAERKCGELLRDMDKAKGATEPGTNRGTTRSDDTTASKTLSEMGVTKDQSSKWQKLAEVPEEIFESVIDNQGMKISGSQILATADPDKNEGDKINIAALWIWGRLRDMERDNLFQTPLSQLIDDMTDGMKPDADRIIPKLKEWINNYD